MQAAFLLLLSCSELCSAYLLADVMTREKCEEVIDLAKTAGLSPSFEKGPSLLFFFFGGELEGNGRRCLVDLIQVTQEALRTSSWWYRISIKRRLPWL